MEKLLIFDENIAKADKIQKNEHLNKDFLSIAKELISTLNEVEFINKLASIIYLNTSVVGVRAMTDSYIKIIGKSCKISSSFQSDSLKLTIYHTDFSTQERDFISNIFEIAQTHLQNILYHNKSVYMLLRDQLTGAYTRQAGMEILSNIFESVKRNDRKGFLAFIDIDNLKEYNDKYGHARGDQILKDFSKTCLNMIRKSDVLVRYGGDEFLLYIDSNEPEKVIERVKLTSIVEFSYGIVSLQNYNSLEEAIQSADLKMYESKKMNKADKKIIYQNLSS
ncbi:GGDEF domain-containing protein [Fervidobacterium sp. 2310opik-2]|uniref:GGDEF domain-containing protein n=1 Tax=Fervidobacterium sp. 2310opik-2 TaxID=1755815 RepID=UPI0013DF05BC|nr:GGDEF domain-containing protein [Fervidobacterium sp. 2310opik-2]KAF2962256.1 hypothetical protein AS161_04750 [Fervidobacterium sp. 2310opik-2]